jgi:hypothetical protein
MSEEKSMPKVITLNPNHLVGVIEKLLELANNGELTNIVVAGFNKYGEIITARADLDVVEQQHLVSFLQVDTTVRTMKETMAEVHK